MSPACADVYGASLPSWVQAKPIFWLLEGGVKVVASRLSRYAGFMLLFFTAPVVASAGLAIAKLF